MSTIYQDILTYVNNTCTNYISTNVAAIASAISPAAYTLLSVYIMLWGVASMRGLIQEPINDMAGRLIKIALIFGIGIQLAEYNQYVTDVFFNGPEQLGLALSGTSASTAITSSLDNIATQGYQIGIQFWNKGGVLNGNVGMYIVAIIIWVLTVAVTAYSCFLIILSKIALSIIISLGPIFIISLLFKTTSNFFNSWIQQLSNYFLIMVLVIAANIFVIGIFQKYAIIVSTTQGITVETIFPFMASSVISLLVVAQIPHIASGLAGGVSLSSYGVGRLAARASSIATKRTLTQGARFVGKATQAGFSASRRVYLRSRRNSISG